MNKILRSAFLVTSILAFTATGALTQSTGSGFTYTFPRVETPGIQLVISNIHGVDAAVRVTFYAANGSVALSSRFSLTAGTQVILDDASTGLGSFSGSAVVESATPLAVTATSNRGGSLETVLPALSGSELVLPFARAGIHADTVVTVFNPGTQAADVLLMLGKADGTLLNGSRFSVSPKESRSLPLNILPLSRADLDAITHVIVRSLGNVLAPGRTVFAEGAVGGLDTGNGVVRQDVGIVHASPVDALGSTVVVPLFVSGFGYFTQVEVVNAADVAQSITLVLRNSAGATIPTARNPITVSVPAHGSYTADVFGTFNLFSETIGSISITGAGRLAAVRVLGSDKSPSLAVIDSAGPSASTFAFQYRSVSRDSFSGLTFINTAAVAADVSLSFVAADGFTVSRAQIGVPAGNQLTRTLADLLPEADSGGFLFVSSSVPIQAAAIEGPNDNSVLSPLPVTPISTGFSPRAQDRFLAVGQARVQGNPLPGATVRLAGPVVATQITDSVGAFVFRDIPPGSYTVSIQMPGLSFSPASTSFTITNANRRDINFEGTIVSSVLTSISPNSVLVGSPGVQITAKGGPFIPSTEIVVDGVGVPTTFVDESTLTATLGASLLRLSRNLSIQVRNRIGTNISPSAPLTFVVGNTSPTITGLSGVPAQIIAGYPGFTVTIIGTGFNEGGTVQFAGVSRAYVWDSPTQVRAFIGPADLAVGRIAKLTVTNAAPTVGPSNAVDITVLNPVAGLLSISPSTTEIKIEPNSTGLRLVVNGFSFKPGATVQVQGFPALQSTYVSSTQLIADIPAQALEVGGSFPVTVSNPPPNLGSSEVLPLIVQNLIPQLNGIDTGVLTFSPGVSESETVPVDFVGVLHGSNFGKGYTAVMIAPKLPFPSCNQPDLIQLSPQVISSTEIVVTLPIRCTGDFAVYVSSPQNLPGGGVSQRVQFSVNPPVAGPVPVLTSLAPPSTAVNSTFTLTINGSNFAPGALVNFGTAILTPSPADISAASIKVTVPSYYVQEKGIIPVTVTNPGTGGTSTRLLFFVN